MYVIFENPGEFDIRAVQVFGVSVKKTDSPIGFFGTGLKYAIAVLLRTRHTVTIQSGDGKVHEFSSAGISFRGEEFSIVTCNGNELGFTTKLGRAWEVWMAYRELMANAKDEGGCVYISTTVPTSTFGITQVIISGDEVLAAYHDRKSIFLESTPIFSNGKAEIHRGGSNCIYYRGFKVLELNGQTRSIHTYNVLFSIVLTEDRTAKYAFELTGLIEECISDSEDENIIRPVLLAKDGSVEKHFNFSPTRSSDKFFSVVEYLVKSRMANVNRSALSAYKERTRKNLRPGDANLTEVQKAMLEKALAFTSTLGLNIEEEIIVTDSLGEGTLGMIEGGRIFISTAAFALGTKQVAATLVEEHIHIKHNVVDETRAMQEILLMMIVSLGEELRGEPI